MEMNGISFMVLIALKKIISLETAYWFLNMVSKTQQVRFLTFLC